MNEFKNDSLPLGIGPYAELIKDSISGYGSNRENLVC